MRYEIANQFPSDMIFKESGQLISIYQPTHRSSPENKGDPILFKNLLRTIESALTQLPIDEGADAIMSALNEIRNDPDFWMHTLDGIAVFASKNRCIIYHLQTPVREYAGVAKRFHITPLIKAFQFTEKYQLLGLSRENFGLFQCNRYGIEEVALPPDAPRTMKEVLGSDLTESYLSHGSYAGAGGPTMYHGHGDVKQEIDKDTEKYFRYIDAFVHENYSQKSKRPLILVALKEYHSIFHKLSNNPYLLDKGIPKAFDSIKQDELLERVRAIIEDIHAGKIRRKGESFAKAKSESLGSSNLNRIFKAANQGRVDTLMIEKDRVISRQIDADVAQVQLDDMDQPKNDNIIDELAELVLVGKGKVLILEQEAMPTDTGVAAIFRYKE